MADKILEVQTITFVSGSNGSFEITLPNVRNSIGSTQKGGEFFPGDKVIYVFQNFTGSFVLAQESGSQSGLMIYDTIPSVQSGPWRLISTPPRWLFNSGSNSQAVEVVKILVR